MYWLYVEEDGGHALRFTNKAVALNLPKSEKVWMKRLSNQ
ncbi:hypothetical protein FORC066_0948 [Yersinia enterocolitica]|nr:hypothetical protein FORC066_0948 [Yersinia enterocolitica]